MATPNPFIAPKSPPINMAAIRGTIRGNGFRSGYILATYVVDCNNEAETIAVKPSIRPAERSVPCNTISPATPSANIPRVDA